MDDDLFEFEQPADAAPELVLGKKKKKKKKKKDVLDEPSASSKHDDEAEPAPPPPSSAFAALDLENEEPAEPAAELKVDLDELPPPVLSKKKKKKKKALVLDAPESFEEAPSPSLAHDDAEEAAVNEPELEPHCEPEAELHTEQAEVRRPMTAAEKKKAKKERERLAKQQKSKKEDDEINAILTELEGPAKPSGACADTTTETPTNDVDSSLGDPALGPMTAAQKKRAKKKKKAAEEATGDTVDALLAEFGGPELTPAEDPTASADAGGIDDLLAQLGGGVDTPAAKKKAKKKKKKAGAKADDAVGEVGEAGAAPAEAQKPKKKESAAVRKMREMREKQMAEEERLRKIREEEEARIAEEERRLAEEVRKKEEEKAKKKAAEKARKERRRQEGTLLSKAEKERRKKAEAFRKQLLEKGLVPAAAEAGESEKPKRVVYGKKKKGGKGKPLEHSEEQSADGAGPASAGTAENKELPQGAVKVPQSEPIPEVVPDAWEDLPEVEDSANGTSVEQNGGATKAEQAAEEADSESESEGDSYDSDDSEYEGMSKAEIAAEKRLDSIRRERGKEKSEALAARTADHLRSPVICILGHVDTGKTKILDRIRKTNVQDGEAGGITQQIGATYFPIDAVKKEATKLAEGRQLEYNVPSLLIIDTPGHESFTNLRSRGSSLCDIAILVVDIMHGLEDQTKESIGLLKLRKTPFIVALNKIDRIYDWRAQPHNCPARDSLAKQPSHAQEEFKRRVRETKLEFAEMGFNTELFWENKDVRKAVSLVPTSAISGEGIPDLLMLLLALPQKLLTERLMFNPVLEATVLEVKVIEGLGTTIDIILTGGTIREGDTLMVVGLDGPIVATIRALLTPHPMKEMRVKGQYLHHKEIKAAQGVKISADGLEKAVAGTQVMVVKDPSNEDEMRYVREEVVKDFQTILNDVDKSGLGVYVQASTLGSLEALLEFLRTSKIPVAGINIGPVHKKDVTKSSTMLEKRKEFATILAFDVSVEKEAREMAEDIGVRIFTADIIYHLFDQFTQYMEEMKKQRREQVNDDVVFPSICKILPQHVYNKKDPIVVGVDVMEGILRVGTPLVVRHGEGWLDIGRVVSIELTKKQVVTAKKGESVAVKIQDKNTDHIMYGRHFDCQDALVSKMSRSAIDLLKENFRDDLGSEDWRLVVKLKKMFDII